MIIELFIILIYTIFCLQSSPKTIVYSIFLLLPLHGFIKFAVFFDSGSLFMLWKEIGILIALFKLKKTISINKVLENASFLLVSITFFFLIIGYLAGYSVAGDVRRFIFAIPLLYLIAKIDFKYDDVKRLTTCIFLGAIMINVTGLFDFAFPEYRLIMRTIMGVKFQIGNDGYVFYDIPSYKINGWDRVCGFMGGGPNMMGVFNAAILLFAVFAFITKMYIKRKERLFFVISASLCVFNLLFSFSRAGWALVFITFLYTGLILPRYRKYALQGAFACLFLGVIAYFTVDSVHNVIYNTFTGNEASSAERGNMTRDAWDYLITNPLGYGLGAADMSSEGFIYTAESTIINFGIATGILGVFLYSYLIFTIYKLAKKNRYNPFYIIAPGFIFAYYITAWVSVNVVENPFLYYAWLIFGLGMNKNLKRNMVHPKFRVRRQSCST